MHQPHGRWMMHIERNLLDAVDGFLLVAHYHCERNQGIGVELIGAVVRVR